MTFYDASSSSVPLEQRLAADADGWSLLLPAVSAGNVPQLCIDLLLSSLPHTLLGCFHSSHVEPCVGLNAFSPSAAPTKRSKKNAAATHASSVLVTPVQLYCIPSLRLLLLQQRSPCVAGHQQEFVRELIAFTRSLKKLEQVFVLTSSAAFRMNDEDLNSVHPISFYIVNENTATADSSSSSSTSSSVASPSSSALSSLLRSTLQWHPLAVRSLQQDESPLRLAQLNSAEGDEEAASSLSVPLASTSVTATFGKISLKQQAEENKEAEEEEESEAVLQPIPVPGLGITRSFFELTTNSSAADAFTTAFLHIYINEGANDRDALVMTQHIYSLFFLQQQQRGAENKSSPQAATLAALIEPQHMQWTQPASWSALFGNESEESLYL